MSIKDNIKKINNDIIETALKSNRNPDEITLIAVSKTFPADKIVEAYNAGLINFGENYVQDFLSKYDILLNKNIKWHFIGHLQSNKIKYIYDKIFLLHTLDSMKLAEKLNNRLTKANKTLDVLIQVNIGEEKSKSGFFEYELDNLFENAERFDKLIFKGFMVIPPYFDKPDNVRPYFIKMREILEKFSKFNRNNIQLKELSMGMSNDFKVAIEEGATYIRIGTSIFGERSCKFKKN